MRSDLYPASYFEGGGDSNYVNYGNDPGWDPTAAVLTSLVAPNAPILEVGCATGWFVRAARQYGLHAYGVDISAWAIAHPADGVKGFISEKSVLDLDEGKFAAVVSWEMLEHVPAEDVPAALAAMKEQLLPGGWLIHRIALADSEHDHHADDDKTHFTVVEREWWLGQFENLGGLTRHPTVEAAYDGVFAGRDWAGRFFAYRLDA